jgi:hypothetical protein
MNNRIAAGILSLLLTAGVAVAQDTDKKTTHKTVRTLTGCLSNGDSANEFKLTASTGEWKVQSDSVKLADHVGHTVKITGVVSNPTMHGMKEDAKDKTEKKPVEKGTITATGLKMVSESCSAK